MESISTLSGRQPQSNPGYALADLIAAAWRTLSRWSDGAAQARQRARTRRELHRLSDHSLRDIGLERGQIERLFG
jgi:uncharacterized protein YjiS (DUF1127 family)